MTNPTPQTLSRHALVDDPRRRRAILVAVCVALMAVIASVSGLNVAQQEFAVAFGASQGTVLWIINGYTLTLAALLLPVGALGDRVGRRPVLLTGLFLFGAASAAAGLATSSAVMISARLLAGAAAAMIMPVTLAVITSTFPDEERSQAIGVWSGVAGAGGLLGMFVSALLVDVASWRWLFALPVALVAAGFVLAARSVRTRASAPASRSTPAVPSCRSWPSSARCSRSTRAPNAAGPTRSRSRAPWPPRPGSPGSSRGRYAAGGRCSTSGCSATAASPAGR